MEYLDIYDKYGEKTGETIERDEAHKIGARHRVVQLWLINARNEILTQLSIDEDIGYNFWYVSVGGHIMSGESVETTLIRETKEELGLDISGLAGSIEYLYTFSERFVLNDVYTENEIFDVFALKFDFDINQITMQAEEVASVKMVPYDEFRQILINKDESFWHHEVGFKMLLIALDDFLYGKKI